MEKSNVSTERIGQEIGHAQTRMAVKRLALILPEAEVGNSIMQERFGVMGCGGRRRRHYGVES